MSSIIDRTVFSEPSGRPVAIVQLCAALSLLGVYGFYLVVGDAIPPSFLLFIIAGTALSGIAESLPKNRRRAAIFLRLLGIFVLVSALVMMTFAPELLFGEDVIERHS